MVKTVQYDDFPALCDELLNEVELTGVTVEVIRNGQPFVRMVPVEATAEGNGPTVGES